MADNLEEQGSEGLDLQRYLDIARRRHLQFLIPAFLGWLLVWGASWFLQARYKSGTLILVQGPTLSKNYVVPNVNDDVQERLQSIKQQVMSRTRLLTIIDKFHLYEGGRRKLSPDDKVTAMGKDIDIELVEDQRGEQITAFRISYWSYSPYVARDVATELTNLFISENQKVLQQQSENTTEFLESSMESARQRLVEQEGKVRAFKAAHEGELPTQQASNMQILNGLQQQLQNEQSALNTARGQRDLLQTQIADFRTVHTVTHTSNGQPTGLAAIDAQLDQLRAKLAELSSHYTDQYPDVIAVKDQIAKAEKNRTAMVAELKNAQNSAANALPTDETSMDPQLAQLQGQLRANQTEITNREQAINELKTQINDYRNRLNAEPASEQQLDELTRGYNQSQSDYDELVKKRNQSEIATSMEHMQQGERFSTLDPASLPLKPDFPNRLKFCGMGLAAGIALGLVFVLGLEFVDGRLHTEKEIKALLPTVVLTEIPEVLTSADERRIKTKMFLGWAMAALVMIAVLAGSAFSYLHN